MKPQPTRHVKKELAWLPWAIFGAATIYLIVPMVPRNIDDSDFNFRGFGALPVQEGGRIQPIDTYARVRLMQISHRMTVTHATYREDPEDKDAEIVENRHQVSPAKWALDAMLSKIREDNGATNPAYEYRMFRIDNDRVVDFLNLKRRPGSWRYAWNEFGRHQGFEEQVKLLGEQDGPLKGDLFQNKIAELYQQSIAFLKMGALQIRMIPPAGRRPASEEHWLTVGGAAEEERHGVDQPAFDYYRGMLSAYDDNNAEKFNKALAAYQDYLERTRPGDYHAAQWEAFFNRFAPFYHSIILYGAIFVLVVVSWLAWQKPLQTAAFGLTCLVLAVHTWALFMRMYFTGRPPVTNLYSSAVFVGWGCVALGIGLEWVFKNGIAMLVAAIAGMATLILAHNMVSGDTMEVLQAVLDTNFWLATHVVCITKGYTAMIVAGLLGMVYIVLGICTDKLRGQNGADLAKMIYGVICFAVLLSFVGTVLGGIWADESWGRFWGWDPKENGALLIVIWSALVLHARWGGLVRARGMANLAIFGNMVTLWSWFGTNLLGVGLHAYGGNTGPMSAGVLWLIGIGIFHMIFIGIGCLPLRYWRSFSKPLPPGGADPSSPKSVTLAPV